MLFEIQHRVERHGVVAAPERVAHLNLITLHIESRIAHREVLIEVQLNMRREPNLKLKLQQALALAVRTELMVPPGLHLVTTRVQKPEARSSEDAILCRRR